MDIQFVKARVVAKSTHTWGLEHSTVGRAIVLRAADPDLISSTPEPAENDS